jgi:hypothetical protein
MPDPCPEQPPLAVGDDANKALINLAYQYSDCAQRLDTAIDIEKQRGL